MKLTDRLTIREWLFIAVIAFLVYLWFSGKFDDSDKTKADIKANTAKITSNKAIIDTNSSKAHKAGKELKQSGSDAVKTKDKLVKDYQAKINKPVQDATYLEKCNYLIYEYGQ